MTAKYFSIKSLAEQERPRERLMQNGVASLSVSELLAIILRSGTVGESAIDVARRILSDCNNSLNDLAKMDVRELVKRYRGIGIAKATGIIVAMELGKRRALENSFQKPVLCSSIDVYNYIAPLLKDLTNEEFWVIYLDRSNRAIGRERLSAGGMSSTVIDVRILFRKVLERKATALLIAHNHPAGSLYPSEQDKVITGKIYDAGQLMDVVLFDHLIIGAESYYSFVDEGIMENFWARKSLKKHIKQKTE